MSDETHSRIKIALFTLVWLAVVGGGVAYCISCWLLTDASSNLSLARRQWSECDGRACESFRAAAARARDDVVEYLRVRGGGHCLRARSDACVPAGISIRRHFRVFLHLCLLRHRCCSVSVHVGGHLAPNAPHLQAEWRPPQPHLWLGVALISPAPPSSFRAILRIRCTRHDLLSVSRRVRAAL